VRRGDDLDDVALAQRVAERHELAVHLRTDAALADLRVDRVGEVDRRGAFRERLHVPLEREDIHLVREQIDPHGVHELARVLHVLLRLDELAQPQERLVELVLARLLLLVEPVRRDALLGDPVHLAGADLDLDRVALGPMTVVWSDWYMLTFGIAMKSLKRPGTGFHSEWMTPRAP